MDQADTQPEQKLPQDTAGEESQPPPAESFSTAGSDDPPANPPKVSPEQTGQPAPSDPVPPRSRFVWKPFWKRPKKSAYTIPTPLGVEEFQKSLEAMDRFLIGNGDPTTKREPSEKEGEHLDFAETVPPFPDAFLNLDLRYACFKGAGLQKQNFGYANVTEADFRDADLSGADLLLVVGLQAHQLSGADLSRCKLPADIALFPQLANVTTLSQNAGKMFLTTLLACIFVLLTVATTGDIQLLTSSGTAELPVLKVSVSTQSFFFIAPLVLLVLSVTVHLYLQRLWETMAQLPAVFPDGITTDNKTYPWLVNDLIRTGFPLLSREQHNTPLAWMQLKAFATIAYATVPITLLIVFMRCLHRHEARLSEWQTVVFAFSVAWASLVSYLNRITLKREKEKRNAFLHRQGSTLWLPVVSLLASLLVGILLAWYACKGTPVVLSAAQKAQVERWFPNSSNGKGGYIVDPALERIDAALQILDKEIQSSINPRDKERLQRQRSDLQSVRDTLDALPTTFSQVTPLAPWRYPVLRRLVLSDATTQPWVDVLPALSPANIVEDTTQLTDKWKPKEFEFPSVPLPPVAKMTDKQAVVTIDKKSLKAEDFQVLDVEKAKYNTDFLRWHESFASAIKRASFQGRNLRFLNARGAFLVNADFRGADMTCADFSDADLRNAAFFSDGEKPIQLDFAILSNTKLDGASLNFANLNGANLNNANLNGAFLRHANLNGAFYDDGHELSWPTGKVPKGWREQPISSTDPRTGGESGYVELVPNTASSVAKPRRKSSAKRIRRQANLEQVG